MGKPRKYQTEEERKAAKRESKRKYQAKYRKNNKEKIAEYRQANKEKIAAYQAEYYQVNKEKLAEYQSEWRLTNKEKYAKYQSEYRQANKDKIAKHITKYYSTPFGRATRLLSGYRRSDDKYNRGECTLTTEWIIEHIFSQPCHYCGKTDWTKMGCDRIDNNLPHTPDNVVPCCMECNIKKQKTPYDEYMRLIENNNGGEL